MGQPRLQYPCFDEEWPQYPEFLHHLVCDLSMKFCIAVKNDGRELNSMLNFYRVPHNLIAIHSREEKTGSELFCSLIPSALFANATFCPIGRSATHDSATTALKTTRAIVFSTFIPRWAFEVPGHNLLCCRSMRLIGFGMMTHPPGTAPDLAYSSSGMITLGR